MKALLIVIVVVSLGVYAVYHFGMAGFDPVKQATDFRAAVVPGTAWQDVVKLAPPTEWSRTFIGDDGGPAKSPGAKYREADFASLMQGASAPAGFVLAYTFTAEHVYDVYFDEQGKVSSVEEPMTFNKLVGGQ